MKCLITTFLIFAEFKGLCTRLNQLVLARLTAPTICKDLLITQVSCKLEESNFLKRSSVCPDFEPQSKHIPSNQAMG